MPTERPLEGDGWFPGDGGTGEAVTAATILSTTNHHGVLARRTAKTDTVTLDTEGGSAYGPLTVIFGAAYGQLCTPTRTGYSCGGWRSGDTTALALSAVIGWIV